MGTVWFIKLVFDFVSIDCLGDGEKKQVRFENPPVTDEQIFPVERQQQQQREHGGAEREEWLAHTILLVLFFLCFVTLVVLGAFLHCRAVNPYAYQCGVAKNRLKHLANVISYYAHVYLFQPAAAN